jgi:AcrR family transcriptional regulator
VSNKRSTKSGRRPGNQDTRGEILTAARHAFAAKGFAGASIRGIAADAGVDAALVHHYFDTKEQLFLATVELPVPIGDVVEGLTAQGIDGLGERIIRTVLSIWDSDLQPSLVAAVRTNLAEPAMSRTLSEFVSLEVIGKIINSLELPAEEARLRTGLVASQLVGVIIGRYVLRVPALAEQSAEILAAAIGPTLQRYLSGEISGPGRYAQDADRP